MGDWPFSNIQKEPYVSFNQLDIYIGSLYAIIEMKYFTLLFLFLCDLKFIETSNGIGEGYSQSLFDMCGTLSWLTAQAYYFKKVHPNKSDLLWNTVVCKIVLTICLYGVKCP